MGWGRRRLPWFFGAALAIGMLACGGFEGNPPGQGPTTVSKLGNSRVISEGDPRFRQFEMPEEEGECEVAEDCSSAGCSGEVCTTAKLALETTTYCAEEHPGEDFSCECVKTRCRWKQDPHFYK